MTKAPTAWEALNFSLRKITAKNTVKIGVMLL